MKFPVKKNNWMIVFLFLGSFLWAQTEFKIPAPPSKIYPVNDYAGVLSPEQKELLNQKLISYSDSTSTQILVCIVNTLDGDDINYVGAKWGNEWKLGQKGTNNGVILLISVQERRLAIQTGRGTEDALTDMTSGLIINQFMVPYLKHNNFYGAVDSGTDQIIAVLQGKFKPDKSKNNNTDDDFSGLGTAILIFIIILFFVFISSGGNNGGGTSYDKRGKRRDGGFWGGGGFFGGGLGSSGGGFGGFGGGGSFGGGGASGNW